MAKDKIRIGLYIVLVLLLTGVPVFMICRYDVVLDKGTLYRFRCEPVDPIDAFRGNYVQLHFGAEMVPYRLADSVFKNGQKVYAFLRVDSAGYARVSRLSFNESEQNDNFSCVINYDQLSLLW